MGWNASGWFQRISARLRARGLLKTFSAAQLAAQLPEIGSAIATWYAYRDQPYAGDLAWYQVTSTAVSSAVVGVASPILLEGIGALLNGGGFSNRGGNSQPRQQNKQKKKHK